jgi:hypothetical protein
VTDAEIRVLQMLIGNATLHVQTLVALIDSDTATREQARCALKACELAEAAIIKAKPYLRRMARKKS